MGGYGAVLYAVKFPDLFGTCVSYDGALHTWETLSELRPATTGDLYGGDESYFSSYSPWTQAARNAGRVRGRVAIRLVVGGIRVLNRRYRRHLSELGIPVDYVETDCRHDLQCVMEEAGTESFAFIAAHLGGQAD
jgi:S-formylglutathione hydrolase FrmB